MRIGDVCKKYKISKYTLYYYIDYGLIVPPKDGTRYYFDKRTLEDLDIIVELKNLRFSLEEIHKIISLRRISGLLSIDDLEDIINIYTSKKSQCLEEIEDLKQTVENLDQEIKKYSSKKSGINRTGVPLSMLDLLSCPECGQRMQIKEAEMDFKYIYEAKINCICGAKFIVKDGILLTGNRNKSKYDKPDLKRELYKDLPFKIISHFQHYYNFMLDRIKEIDFNNKVVLETYINAWFFIHNHISELDESAKYIVVDKYPETILMYKEIIEKQGKNLDILYIADSTTNLPLVKNCIDVNIDFFAINEHNFYKDSFLIKDLLPYLKEKSDLIGIYYYYKDRKSKSVSNLLKYYPESSKKTFSLDFFLKSMKDCGYSRKLFEALDTIEDTGKNLGFGFHEKGDKLDSVCYFYRNY
ncbi:MerR family transcriptional regulator [Peptoniphilus catoniae]|uniref:MerR family transcriptional regulator n=1 Tax=Peptoniphilus catoniae TaxID=1660341 RepID=UPI0010FCF800|nr:MerR family transcriptional regulator [Peptoniphilus catoniae]